MAEFQSNSQPSPAGGRASTNEAAIYGVLARMVASREAGVLATVVAASGSTPRRPGAKMIVHADGSLTGTIGGGAAEALVISRAAAVLSSGECQIVEIDLTGEHGVCGGLMEVFVEPILRSIPFFVFGAGHVGQAVTDVGRGLGFHFTVVDDRPEFLAQAGAMPGVDTLCAGPDELAGKIQVAPRAAALMCTRNHELDAAYLQALMALERERGQEFAFVGALGSRRKARQVRSVLAADPACAPRLSALRLPVGLDLGAETPAEIALSILAEVMAVMRGIPKAALADGGEGYRLLGPS